MKKEDIEQIAELVKEKIKDCRPYEINTYGLRFIGSLNNFMSDSNGNMMIFFNRKQADIMLSRIKENNPNSCYSDLEVVCFN